MTKSFTLVAFLFLSIPLFLKAQENTAQTPQRETLPGINTKFLEVRPLISGNGRTLYFSRRYYPENLDGVKDFQDVYVSTYDSATNSWSKGENLGKVINNNRRNAIASINADGTEGIFFNTYKGIKNAPLVRSRKTDKGWSKPQAVNINNYVNLNDYADYHLDFRNNVLFSSIEGEGDNFGEQDIYISTPNGFGGWKEPVNLGEVINTASSEFAPFLGSDGRSLFFCSYGHGGLGSSDIFVSIRLDDTWKNWSTPVNLGPTINTAQEESFFSIPDDFSYIYLSSHTTRQADRDITRVQLPDDFTAINGPILVQLDSAAINAIMLSGNYKINQDGARRNFQGIAFEGWPADEAVAQAETPEVATTETAAVATNNNSTTAPAGESSRYAGFKPVNEVSGLSPQAEEIKRYLQQQFSDEQFLVRQQGNTVEFKIVQNMLYDFNSIYVSTDYLPRLRKLGNVLKEKEQLKVQLIGHTDEVGSAEANKRVANQRVDNIENYLSRRGISDQRIEALGVGTTEPLVANDTEENRRTNRRVETIIIMNQ